jgi:transposase
VNRIICGVDVSKAKLDACVRPGAIAMSFSNDAEGVAALAAFCREYAVELVAFEATGGYERLAFLLLWEQGMACAMLNPRMVRLFAEAMGYLEKTDQIDALVIAHFAEVKGLKPTAPPSPKDRRLKAFVTRLRQLSCDIAANTLRRNAVSEAAIQDGISEVLALLRRQAKKLEGEIMSLIDDDPLWQALEQAFRTIKGVASRTVSRLLAEVPEIGIYDNKAIAKLTGLAPLARDSGASSGPRPIRGGRSPIRSTLYTVGYIVAKHDPRMKRFADRLKAQGKPAMVVRIAVARKLLVWLNAKARDARASLAHAT